LTRYINAPGPVLYSTGRLPNDKFIHGYLKTDAGAEFNCKLGGALEKPFNYIANLAEYIGRMYAVRHFGDTGYNTAFLLFSKGAANCSI
jgi:hypothetical protein